MPASHPAEHNFHPDKWWARHDCARQRQFRALAPMPFGSVLIARDEMDEETIRWHLRQMRELGFNAIKQFMGCDRWPRETLERMALEEGLVAWWYGEGGWEPVTDELCRQLGIDPSLSLQEKHAHPDMRAHQFKVLEGRIGRDRIKVVGAGEKQAGFDGKPLAKIPEDGRVSPDAELPDWLIDHFVDWLRETYDDDISKLHRAWNCDSANGGCRYYEDWEAVKADPHVNQAREYGRVRDLLRFKAEFKARKIAEMGRLYLQRDPFEPNRAGGEMGLFLPFASRGTDMSRIADEMKHSGSFYPSIHLCWHFEETYFEVARPVYMQAASVVDWNKGGWTAPWESTGGPQQMSGTKAFLFPPVSDQQPGFTVDAGVMAQLLLSYLAAGCKGAGLWSWNARIAGFEAGEYALLDRNEQVCERTRRVGRIAKAATRYREELWQAVREPQVGILADFDNEAIWAAISECQRTHFKYRGVEGRIGAARTCIDASITYESLTGNDLRAGLLPRYPIVYLPSVIGLTRSHLPALIEYVENGGRLVADMPAGCYDETGRVLFTKQGTDFERLFGCELADLQYSGNNVDWFLDGELIEGFTADLNVTDGKVLRHFSNGRPAVVEHTLGKGSAILLGWEAARACYLPGNPSAQKRLAKLLLGGALPFYRFESEAVAYRLPAPNADHYFIINEGEATEGTFSRLPYAYASATDAETGEAVDICQPIAVGTADARWIRCQRG